jgi:hypothetical protein
MKTNYKILICGLGVLAVFGVVVPGTIIFSAQQDQATQAFCTKVSEYSLKVEQKIIDREAGLEQKREQINNRFRERWEKQDSDLDTKRDKWDDNREDQYSRLRERATTEEQKQAVEAFKNSIQVAISARRSAVDAALSVYRQGIEQAFTSRKSSVDAALDVFRNSIKTAFNQAQTDCAGGTDFKTIRQDLKAGLKTAREKFVSDKQAIEKTGPSVSGLVTAKNQAIQKAFQDFKTATEQARTALKTAFGEE